MTHYPHNPEEDMRPIPPAPANYRIKEFIGVFTIEKLVKVKIKSKTFWDWLYYGRYYFESDYHILTDRGNLFKPFVEAHPITKKFKSLKEAKQELEKIISETEVKYHNF